MFFMIFQLIPPVLLTPTNYCFNDQVIPLPDRLGVVYQTLTKLDMVQSDLLCGHRWLPQSYSAVREHMVYNKLSST